MNHPKISTDATGDLWLNFGDYGQEVEIACFSGDGKRLLTVQEVGVARVWDVASGTLEREIRPDSPLAGSTAGPTTYPFEVFIEAVALDLTGQVALLGLNDGTAGLFTVADGSRLTTFHHPERAPAQGWELIRAVSLSPDGSLAAVGFYGRCVGVWSVPEGRSIAFLRSDMGYRLHHPDGWGRDTLVSSLAFSPDGRFVFAGHSDMTATLWELETGQVVFDPYEHQEQILALWQDGDVVRWASSGGVIWESSADGSVRRLETGESWTEVTYAADGDFLLVRTAEGQVKRWTLSGGSSDVLVDLDPLLSLPSQRRSLGVTSEGRAWFYPLEESRLALATGAGHVEIPCKPRRVRKTFDPRGELIATHHKKQIWVWAVPSGELIWEFTDAEDLSTVAFSPSGKFLASGTPGAGVIARSWPASHHLSLGHRKSSSRLSLGRPRPPDPDPRLSARRPPSGQQQPGPHAQTLATPNIGRRESHGGRMCRSPRFESSEFARHIRWPSSRFSRTRDRSLA